MSDAGTNRLRRTSRDWGRPVDMHPGIGGLSSSIAISGGFYPARPTRSPDRPGPTVAVIVSHLNSERTLRACLERLISQSYARGSLEILVVDGGSTDRSMSIVKSLRSERLSCIEAAKASEAEGQAIGVERTRSDVVIFTNSDVYVPEDWVDRHVNWIDQGYDIVGGRVFWGGDLFSLAWNDVPPVHPTREAQDGLGYGFANLSVRRGTLNRCGGVPRIRSQQDTVFIFRAFSAGARAVLDPAIEVYHDHPLGSIRVSITRAFTYAVNHAAVERTFRSQPLEGRQPSEVVPKTRPFSALAEEVLLVRGVRVHRNVLDLATSKGVKVRLAQFLAARIVGRTGPHVAGVIVGMLRRGTLSSAVLNAHVGR
jgi:glycosyltransferase involved in cell wall biosynthesis